MSSSGTRTPNPTPYLCNEGHPALLVEVRPGHFEATLQRYLDGVQGDERQGRGAVTAAAS